jgi:hypothetical protein
MLANIPVILLSNRFSGKIAHYLLHFNAIYPLWEQYGTIALDSMEINRLPRHNSRVLLLFLLADHLSG